MKPISILICILFVVIVGRTQRTLPFPTFPSIPEITMPPLPPSVFANQGEQDVFWAKRIFYLYHCKQKFKRYAGHIVIVGNRFTYGDEEVSIDDSLSPGLNLIFSKGIFYPGISNVEEKIKDIQNMPKPDSVLPIIPNLEVIQNRFRIANFEELLFLNTSPQIKRFWFWLFTPRLLNPVVYFIELTNAAATNATSLENFITGCELTFYKQGWVII